MNALEIRQLTKVYKGKRGKRVEALLNLDLQVAQGEIFGFLGPNGAGKSTTIKTIMGHIKATGGTVAVFGVPVSDAASRRKVGYLPENPAFYDFMTASEYLVFVGRAFSMDEGTISKQSQKVLALLDLTEAAGRPIRSYSKGMVQRLGLAQTLLHEPDLYILDEPMSGLDPIGRALVKDIIKDLKKQGKTVFFSTHITSDVEVVCDRVGVIVKGRLQAVDRVQSILEAGIQGYNIVYRSLEGRIEEAFVETDKFKAYTEHLVASKFSLERIEPKRKDLEAFFLEIVSRERHAAE